MAGSLLLLLGCGEEDVVSGYCSKDVPCPASKVCDLPTNTCMDPGAIRWPDGRPCQQESQCKSGLCVDEVCCDVKCDGACQACDLPGSVGTCCSVPAGQDPAKECTGQHAKCGGACDGKGACAYALISTTCASASCKAGSLMRHLCDGKGACGSKTETCGGYVCETGGQKCKTSCGGEPDCTTGFFCLQGKCVGQAADGSPCGTNNDACQSGYCVDGVCCNEQCDAECRACNLSGFKGTCSFIAANTDPRGECTGTKECGSDLCDGKGACTPAKPSSTQCKNQCQSANLFTMDIFYCDGKGACSSTPQNSIKCTPYKCTGTAPSAACAKTCKDHSGCASTSVCDRTQAHKGGSGACVDPAKVLKVSKGGAVKSIAAALPLLVSGGLTHLRLEAGTYAESLTIPAIKVSIVGVGQTVIAPPTGDAFNVSDGAALTLQGITLDKGSHGISCKGSSAKTTTVTVVESTIQNSLNYGIKAQTCDLILRRSVLKKNNEGGALLSGGSYTVVNNLVAQNGYMISTSAGSTMGGLKLSPCSSCSAVVVNNTVVDNECSGYFASGIICSSSSIVVKNSILWISSFSPGGLYSACSFTHSDVKVFVGKPPSGAGNISKDPKLDSTHKPGTGSPCVDAGDKSAISALSTIDFAGNGRIKGTNADMGAYEVK